MSEKASKHVVVIVMFVVGSFKLAGTPEEEEAGRAGAASCEISCRGWSWAFIKSKASRRTCSSRGSCLRYKVRGPWSRLLAKANSHASPSASEVKESRRISALKVYIDMNRKWALTSSSQLARQNLVLFVSFSVFAGKGMWRNTQAPGQQVVAAVSRLTL